MESQLSLILLISAPSILLLIILFKSVKREEEIDVDYIINKEDNKITILFQKIQHFRNTHAHEIVFEYDYYFEWVKNRMLNNYERVEYDPVSSTKTTIVETLGMNDYHQKLLDKTIKQHIKHFINDYKKQKS